MPAEIYRYQFKANVSLEDVEAVLLLAVFGAEALHGEAQVRLDAGHHFSAEKRVCVIDATTAVGRDINRLFFGYLLREVPNDAIEVRRVGAPLASQGLG